MTQFATSEPITATVDARSTKGNVRNSLPTRDNAEHTVLVHARTRLDDIVVHTAVA